MPARNPLRQLSVFHPSGGLTTVGTVLLGITLYLILLATFHAYNRGLPGSFLIDDALRIEPVEPTSLDTGTLKRHIEETDMGGFGRPVSLASLFITKHIYGNSPEAFKHENILYHLLTGIVLFALVYRVLASPVFRGPIRNEQTRIIFALVVATLWLLHPLHVSTVLYAVQRMTILATLFTLLSILLYIIARQASLDSRLGIFCLFVGLPCSMALAVLSKDNAALIPVYILIVECVFYRWRFDSRNELRILVTGTALFLVIPMAVGGTYFVVHYEDYLYDYAVRDFTLAERLATQPVILWEYVGLLLIPQLSEMSLYHDAVTVLQPGHILSVAAMLGWGLVLLLSVYFLRHHPVPCFGVLFFLSSHMMESSFLPLELMFEHRNYLGSAGLIIAVVYALREVYRRHTHGPLTTIVTIALLSGILYFQTSTRAQVWSDEELLLTITLSDHPASGRAASALANVQLERGRMDFARETLVKSIATPPDRSHAGLRLHLFSTYCLDDVRPPEGLYSAVLRDLHAEPISAYVLSGMRVIERLRDKGKCNQFSTKDILSLYATAAENPLGRRRTLFYANYMAGNAFLFEQHIEQSVQFYRRALDFSSSVARPHRIRAMIGLADGLIELEEIERAQTVIQEAQRLLDQSNIDYPGLQVRLGNQRSAIETMERP